MEWYLLGSHYKNEDCRLYTFFINGGVKAAYRKSKVAKGSVVTGEYCQITLNTTILDNWERYIDVTEVSDISINRKTP